MDWTISTIDKINQLVVIPQSWGPGHQKTQKEEILVGGRAADHEDLESRLLTEEGSLGGREKWKWRDQSLQFPQDHENVREGRTGRH